MIVRRRQMQCSQLNRFSFSIPHSSKISTQAVVGKLFLFRTTRYRKDVLISRAWKPSVISTLNAFAEYLLMKAFSYMLLYSNTENHQYIIKYKIGTKYVIGENYWLISKIILFNLFAVWESVNLDEFTNLTFMLLGAESENYFPYIVQRKTWPIK